MTAENKVLSTFWKITLNGIPLDQSRNESIESIDLVSSVDGSDTCTLTVNDPDFYFIEDNIFIEEATIEVIIGWNEDTHREVFSGYISAIDISFPSNGFPILSIFCIDSTSHLMNRVANTNSWDNTTNAEVIELIAQSYGLKCVVEQGYDFTIEETITQSNTTDIEFCESLASTEREPFMCKVIGDTMYYVKKGITQEPEATLCYSKYPYDVVSFSPKITKEILREEITVSNINTEDKSVDTATATDGNTERDQQGESPKTSSEGAPLSINMQYNPVDDTWIDKEVEM